MPISTCHALTGPDGILIQFNLLPLVFSIRMRVNDLKFHEVLNKQNKV